MTSDLRIQGEVVVNSEQAESAFNRVGDKATQMANEVATSAGKAGQAVDKIGDGAGASAEKFTRAESRISASIKRATNELELLGKTASQRLEFNIADKGLDAAKFEPALKKLRELEAQALQAQRAATGSLDKMGISAAQTAAALRGVPAQFTDIITSLQGGQAPLTVFLQQGGQLKDMFGGAGNAAKALGGYVVGLINPFTLAAAGAAALAVAYNQGSAEADGYRMALVMTGNAAGTTAAQMQQMAARISSVVGTQGAAAEALAQMASSGRVASQSLEYFSEVAIKFERTTGTAISETVKRFAELGASPVDASRKLNEETNYLTASIYEQIKALKDQGREADAAALAQNTYADALNNRSAQITQNLGAIEGAWKAIKDAAKSGWDAMLNVGRADSLGTQIDNMRAKIAQAKGQDKNRPFSMPWDTSLADLEKQLSYLTEQERVIRRGAEAQAQRTQAEKEAIAAADALQKTQASGMTNQQKMNKALEEYARHIEKLKATNPASVLLSPDAIARGEKAIRDQFSDKGKGSAGIKAANKDLADQQRIYAELAGVSSTYHKELAAAQEQRAKGNVSEAQYVAYVNDLIQKQPFAVALAKEEAKEQQTLAKANLDAAASREKYLTSLQSGIDKIRADIQAQEDATARMGLSKEAIAELDAAKLEMLATDLELQAIKAMDRNLDQQTYDALKEQAKLYRELGIAKKAGAAKEAALEMEKANAEAAKKAQDEWQKATDQINQSLTDALMRGFESGKDFAKNMRDTIVNMFKTLVLRPVISAVLSPISGGIQGMMGGMAGGAAGGSNPIGMASNGSSLWSGAGNIGSALFGNSMAYGAAVPGLSMGSQQAAMLAAQTGEFGFAGLNATSAAGASASGAGMGAMGALGAVAWIGAIAALANTPASPHTGGASTAGAAVKPADLKAAFDGIDAKTQANLDKLTGSSTALLNFFSKLSGGQGGYSVSAAYAADGRDAASGDLVIKRLDQVLSNWDSTRRADMVSARDFAMGDYASLLTAQTDSGEAAGMADAGPKIAAMVEDQWAQYLEAVKGDLMAQMQASGADLPAWARKMLVPLANVSAEDFATELDKITKQIIALPETIAQQIGYNRDTVVSAWVDGLRTGDATAAGIKAADTFVSGIETQMLTSAAGKIQDIVFSGAIVPIVDSLMQGATLSQALAEANLDEVIKKAQAQAQAFAAVWGNADFQAALAGIHDGYAKVMGDLGTTLNYTPVYTKSTQAAAAAQSDLAAAQSDATRAAEQEAQRLADLHKSLTSDLASLDIELLRRSGQSAAADAAARAKATEGYDAEALALYDLIAVRRAHIADLDAEAARAQQLDGLYAGIYAKIATPAERMAYGYERIAASLQNAGLYAGQSDLASILAEASMPQVRDTVQKLWGESSSQTRLALLDAVGALSDLKTEAASLADQAQQTALNLATQNANAALAIVQRAIDAEKKAGQERLRLAQTEETRLKSLVDYLHGQTLDLYGQSDSTAQWMAAQGQAYIDAALAGGALDRDKLGEAVSAIRATLKPDLFGSAKDMEFQTLVLAGKLGTLEQSTSRQLTAAQRSLKAEEDAAKALDDLAQTQRDALDIARGQYTGILGVQDAIKQLSAAILAEKAISGIMQGSIAGSTYAPKTDTLHSAVTGLDYSGAPIGGYLKALNAAGDNAGALDAYQQLTANGATSAMVSKLTGWSLDQINTWVDANNLPRFAGGGWHDGGWAMVGEQGPELAYMPPARIYNAGDTAAMVRGDGGYAELVTEVRALRADIAQLLGPIEAHTRKTADLTDKATEGGNAMRTLAVEAL